MGDLSDTWSCGGFIGDTRNSQARYYTTAFGCWTDSNGDPHSDPGDNCQPWCLTGAAGQGVQAQWNALCGGLSGPACEESLNWYVADADRFGCTTRLKLTAVQSGRSAVVVVIDRGPACSVENSVDFWVLDMSYPAANYLLGGPTSATERVAVGAECGAVSGCNRSNQIAHLRIVRRQTDAGRRESALALGCLQAPAAGRGADRFAARARRLAGSHERDLSDGVGRPTSVRGSAWLLHRHSVRRRDRAAPHRAPRPTGESA